MNLTKRIESVILSNLTPHNERRIGIECESILYNSRMQRIPVNPCDEYSATDLLKELVELQKYDKPKAGYSLEPGGQLEWASPPLQSLSDINKQYLLHSERLLGIAKREKLLIINYALEPQYKPPDIGLIDSVKYRLMDKMFRKTGNLGHWMMRNSASVQINIDFSSKAEAEKMAFIADCLSPITSILFANSPFENGKLSGTRNLRYEVWNDTDNSRCGDLLVHGMLSPNNLINDYIKYVQQVPAIFIIDNTQGISDFNGNLGEWFEQLDKSRKLKNQHIQTALHQIFTHIRFKNVLEIRGSDRPPNGFEFAPAAFWIGLLFDDIALMETFNIVNKWSSQEREQLISAAGILEVSQIGPEEKTILEWIHLLGKLSLAGLSRRSIALGISNESYLLSDYLDRFYSKRI